MQETGLVPNPNSHSNSSSGVALHHENRSSRPPRVQLLRNKSDQRVPVYWDQTVPVWPVRQNVRESSNTQQGASGSSGSRQELQGRGHGVHKAGRATRRCGTTHTAWLRSLKEVVKASSSKGHAANVSEILRDCLCDMTPGSQATASLKWSGIEQDLFSSTVIDPKTFVVPSAADLITKKDQQ